MPLHLLGKKSWNVYNPANIERVKRDEAEAQKLAEAEEKRQQEVDAERRLAILRGEAPPSPPPPPPTESEANGPDRRKRGREDEQPFVPGSGSFRDRKKRKRYGEDDTDFEMRLASERAATASASAGRSTVSHLTGKANNAPIVDSRGHIALFPELEAEDTATSQHAKNEEAERDAAKKRRELEDQYTMRFSNAAGRDGVGVTGSGPWYTSSTRAGSSLREAGGIQPPPQGSGKDVWGNDDPNRQLRDAARISTDDPLAMMKRGAAKARDVEKERRAINEEKSRELRELRKEEKRRERRRRHRDDTDDLEGFTLDGQCMSNDKNKDRDRSHREHRSRLHHKDEPREDHHRSSYHGRHRDRDYSHHRDDHHKSSRHQSGRLVKDREDKEEYSAGQARRKQTRADHY